MIVSPEISESVESLLQIYCFSLNQQINSSKMTDLSSRMAKKKTGTLPDSCKEVHRSVLSEIPVTIPLQMVTTFYKKIKRNPITWIAPEVTGIVFSRPNKRKILAGKSLRHSELQKVFVRKLNENFSQEIDNEQLSCQAR